MNKVEGTIHTSRALIEPNANKAQIKKRHPSRFCTPAKSLVTCQNKPPQSTIKKGQYM
jgi:hypothetical protein